MDGWVVVSTAVFYIALLFAVASYGDRVARSARWRRARPLIYALSLSVYCTSWTFFGSVGLAVTSGLDFLPVYVGPAVMLLIGLPLLRRIVRLAKAQNITSVADFVAARYGKSQAVAAIVTIIAVVAAVPYIALQLKAISASVTTMAGYIYQIGAVPDAPILSDSALLIAVALAVFSILFGTRHIDATEHQHGLMLAIATESIVKLGAFLAVGLFVTFGIYGGPGELWSAMAQARATEPGFMAVNLESWLTITLLSFGAIVLLPRQFHVMVVENHSERDLAWARWAFPAYLVLINLFVIPIAAAGLQTLGRVGASPDMYVLSLPMSAGANLVSLIAFIGGLSAATAMVIVASVAVSIMVCNDLVMPFLLRRDDERGTVREDMGRTLLTIRRIAIFAVLLLAYAYYRTAGNSAALASIGLMSFAAIAQLAPAFFGGLFWRRATARGAIWGTLAGFAVWAYTLLLPTFAASGLLSMDFVTQGPFGIAALRPHDLVFLDLTPLTHGTLVSLAVNVATYVVLSLTREPRAIERSQASVFVDSQMKPLPGPGFWRSEATVGELTALISRYLGRERTERALQSFADENGVTLDPGREVDLRLLRYSEHLLASAIGAPSSRLVLALLLGRHGMTSRQALRLLDEASAAIVHNRDLLQSAIDHVDQGIIVLDSELRLSCWNRRFRELLDLPPELGRVGIPLRDIARFRAERGDFGEGDVEDLVDARVERLCGQDHAYHEHLLPSGRVLEVHGTSIPDGGWVATYTDITDRVRTAKALERSNETLERRVRERTEELMRLNRELEVARAAAEAANLGKTRFLAAASHDILQPLNAARLYASSLTERTLAKDERSLAQNVDASLDAVEEILSAILDISRLDTGALRPELTSFDLGELLQQLKIEFEPLARERGLELRVVGTSLAVRSDRRLLRRLLRNLISNALKYTERGTVLVGCRRAGDTVRVEIHDTGSGIPLDKQAIIFDEFQRLEDGARRARGLGLGLSIVERIGRVLDHPVGLRSTPGQGSVFHVEISRAAALAEAPAVSGAAPAPAGPLGSLTALCIDNEKRILDGMATLLAGWGSQAVCATSAEGALAAMEGKAAPDVVLADYHLDDGTGLQAIARLRGLFGQELPAVLVTADRSEELRAAAQKENVAILFKPLKAAALRSLLAQHVRRAEAAE
ncbi:PAS domain-containing hybrid sensor histidine kinase/response regulator [Lutibaculum baratangense]|uniref:histidine kinase n=1 Tax=Lutibaculum baratangense AMV1 TaxID=631454 RepID=V4R3D5_9HYPH|nr:PAS domain-containing hybrid sensor histidine kinase/response regulator [Lutibaculum baratangense]ESR26427.1 Sensor histidine kinase [Lutibaculum baratangense AMV1]